MDHVGGNTDAGGKLVFPNARYVMSRDEWTFWTSDPDLAQLKAEEEMKQFMLAFARKNLPPLKGRLDLVDREKEILPGIKAIAAPGHTPGHMALAVSSRKEQLLFISDTALHPIHLEQPGWFTVFDLVPEQAEATRRQLLRRAATEKALVMTSHFPFPGLGHVRSKEEVWEWQPIGPRG